MKNLKTNFASKVYTLLGKGFFTCATSGVGLVLGGPVLAILGVLIGTVGGDLLEKGVSRLVKNN